MKTTTVTPKSKKAKNRLANMMNNDAQCIIEQQKDGKVFLASMNNRYFFWVSLDNDPDWMLNF